MHPQYNASSFSRDLSILTLNRAVEYTDHIRAACLWPENQLDLSYVIGKRGSVSNFSIYLLIYIAITYSDFGLKIKRISAVCLNKRGSVSIFSSYLLIHIAIIVTFENQVNLSCVL